MTKLLYISFFTFVCITLIIQNSNGFPLESDADTSGLSPDDCRADEDFLECGTCEKSCKNPNPNCDSKCKPPMCKCKSSTVRAVDGQCIKPEECPPKLEDIF